MTIPLPPGFQHWPHVREFEGGIVGHPVPPGFVPRPVVPAGAITQSMEATEGPWLHEQYWGQQFQGQLPAEDEVIALIQTPALSGPPQMYGINFFRSNRGVATEADPTRNAELRCVVEYGCGGIFNTTEIDLISGVQFSVVANKLTLSLRTYNPVPDSLYSPYELIAAVVIGKGNGANPLPPTFTTQFIQSDAGALGFTVDVPDFARSLCFHTTETDPTELAKLQISFVSPAVGIKVVNVGALYGELTREKGIAIPAGTNQITVGNTAVLTNSIRAALQFFLSL